MCRLHLLSTLILHVCLQNVLNIFISTTCMCRVYRLGTCTCNNLFVRSELAAGAQVDGVGEVDHVGYLDQHVYTVAPTAVVLLDPYNQSRKKNNRFHDPVVLLELMNTHMYNQKHGLQN